MGKLKLLLDVDEVICFSGYLEMVNEFLGTNYKIDDFTDYYIDGTAIPKDRKKEFNDFIQNINQYENPVLLPGAVEAIKRLSKLYDIYLCTDCLNIRDLGSSGRNYMNKYNFLYKTFPQDIIPSKNYIFTATKNLYRADAQVDDLVRNFDLNTPGKFLFPSYHNKDITDDELKEKGIIRSGYDWAEGWEILEKQLIDFVNNNKED